MRRKLKFILLATMIACTASGALAATKHRPHVKRHHHADSAFALSLPERSVGMPVESGAMLIQDRGYRESVGDPWFGSK